MQVEVVSDGTGKYRLSLYLKKYYISWKIHLVAVVEAVKVTIGSLKHRDTINLLIKVYPLAWNDDLNVFEQLAQVLCCEGGYRHDHDEWLVQLFETSENFLLLAEWWIGYNDISLALDKEVILRIMYDLKS